MTLIEALPRDLLHEPLDWFFAEHYRHRQFCQHVTEAAARHVFDEAEVTALLDFLNSDLALHIVDEEEDLFPLLRRRALPEDEIEDALGRLSAEHQADAATAALVRERLQTCLATRTAPGMNPATHKALLDFAAQELSHLALENAVILPIARLRLSPRDLRGLSRRLAARRGLVLEPAGA